MANISLSMQTEPCNDDTLCCVEICPDNGRRPQMHLRFAVRRFGCGASFIALYWLSLVLAAASTIDALLHLPQECTRPIKSGNRLRLFGPNCPRSQFLSVVYWSWCTLILPIFARKDQNKVSFIQSASDTTELSLSLMQLAPNQFFFFHCGANDAEAIKWQNSL